MYSLGEVIFDLSASAAFYMKALDLDQYDFDSRDLYASIFDWAKEFEDEHADGFPMDEYLETVDMYAVEKLCKYFDGCRVRW